MSAVFLLILTLLPAAALIIVETALGLLRFTSPAIKGPPLIEGERERERMNCRDTMQAVAPSRNMREGAWEGGREFIKK